VYPRLWLLTKTQDCRIFQNKSVPDIVKAVLNEHGVTDIDDALSGTYAAREYCVQYRETAFDFVSRLLESEGIFYYFVHSESAHTLVLADDGANYPAGPADLKIALTETGEARTDMLAECAIEVQVTSDQSKLDDYNFETPSTDLLGVASGDTSALTVYDYPAGRTTQSDVEALANKRVELLELPRLLLRAEANNAAIRPGHSIQVSDHARTSANAKYVVRTVSHQATQETYSNRFDAFPSDTPFRPDRRTPAPRIHGCQTALVVGKSGEEITTDQYGRVKVKFHWDQAAASDETSSCWVRVAQAWAGKQFGAFFVPRIGQEVVVSFLEGDPDQPIITGSVYNAKQTVPYALPDNQTRSLVKTNSSKGGGGSNEICFEDKKDEEDLYIHAQKDMHVTVLNDQTSTIAKNRSVTIQEVDDTLKVEKGKRTVTVAGDEAHTNQAKLTYTVSDDFELKVAKNVKVTIDGNLTLNVTGTVTIESTGSMDVASKAALNQKSTGAMAIESSATLGLKAAATLKQEGAIVEVKGSGMNTVEAGGVMTVKGAIVKVEGSLVKLG
jgi:type VI secretion system secreted protein VgrG